MIAPYCARKKLHSFKQSFIERFYFFFISKINNKLFYCKYSFYFFFSAVLGIFIGFSSIPEQGFRSLECSNNHFRLNGIYVSSVYGGGTQVCCRFKCIFPIELRRCLFFLKKDVKEYLYKHAFVFICVCVNILLSFANTHIHTLFSACVFV